MSCLTVTILLAIICVYYIHQKEKIKLSMTDVILISLIMYILLSKIKSKNEKFQVVYPNSEIDKTNMYKCQSDCVSAMNEAQFLIDNPTLSLSDCVMECMKTPK
jgi:hypothetical protein